MDNTSYGFSYTSQLHVTLTSDLVNSWIECVYDNGLNEALVGSLNITASKSFKLATTYKQQNICPC